MFAFHKEDMDLASINFLHHGKPKFWYVLGRNEGPKLEGFLRRFFSDGFSKCPEFLRHKTTLANPYLLKKAIPDLVIHKVCQEAGEFVVTLPASYHCGFNFGFNLAEAVNFGTPETCLLLKKAKSCRCIRDSVQIDPAKFIENIQKSINQSNSRINLDNSLKLMSPFKRWEIQHCRR